MAGFKPDAEKAKEKKLEIEKLIQKAKTGVEEYFKSPEDMKKYLDFRAKFYNYSFNNTSLIQAQFPGAEAVGSFNFFKQKGFSVKRGEKAILIRAHCTEKEYLTDKGWKNEKYCSATEKEAIKNNKLKERTRSYFKNEYVFDISQTTAKLKDIPKLFPNRWLEGNVKNYQNFMEAIQEVAKKQGTKILDAPPQELGVAKGVSFSANNAIALNPRNSEIQNLKTIIHELAHAKLHSASAFKAKNPSLYTRPIKEMQAEMTAYVVCQHFGIDTSDYSFGYISEWTKGIDLNEKTAFLNEVGKTAQSYIYTMEEYFEKHNMTQEQQQSVQLEDAPENETKQKQIAKEDSIAQKNNVEPQKSTMPYDPKKELPKLKKNLAKEGIAHSPKLIKNMEKVNSYMGKTMTVKQMEKLQKSKKSKEFPEEIQKALNNAVKTFSQKQSLSIK